MVCPQCEHTNILFSDDRTLHFVRRLTNSPKRYCPRCHQKWRVKLRYPNSIGRELVMVAVAGIIGFGLFFVISHMTASIRPRPLTDMEKKIQQGQKMMKQLEQQQVREGLSDSKSIQEAMKYVK